MDDDMKMMPGGGHMKEMQEGGMMPPAPGMDTGA